MADDPNAPPQVPMQPGALPQQLFGATPQMPQLATSSPDDLTASMVAASNLGQQQFAADAQRRAALANQLAQLQQQQQGLPLPQTGYRPQFQPMDSAGHVLGDIGKGLLLGLGATGPGRAIQEAKYGPGEREYQMKAGSLAGQIAEIQKQMGSESEAMSAAGGMTAKPMTAAARVAVGEMNNQTRQLHDRMWQDIQGQKLKLDQQLGQGKITAENYRTQMEQIINAAHDRTAMAVAGMTTDQRDRDAQLQSFEQEYRINRENLLSGALGGAVGILPQQPSQTPNAPPGPKARGSSVRPTVNTAPARPANVPANYIFKENGPKGRGWYKPTNQ